MQQDHDDQPGDDHQRHQPATVGQQDQRGEHQRDQRRTGTRASTRRVRRRIGRLRRRAGCGRGLGHGSLAGCSGDQVRSRRAGLEPGRGPVGRRRARRRRRRRRSIMPARVPRRGPRRSSIQRDAPVEERRRPRPRWRRSARPGRVPPMRAGLVGEAEAGNASRSGGSKSSRPSVAQSMRAERRARCGRARPSA